MTCHSRKITGVINKMNKSCIPFSITCSWALSWCMPTHWHCCLIHLNGTEPLVVLIRPVLFLPLNIKYTCFVILSAFDCTLFLFQHRVPHTVLWVHRGQQLLGCDPLAPSALGLSGAQRDRLVPGHHHCRHPRSVQGYGEQESPKKENWSASLQEVKTLWSEGPLKVLSEIKSLWLTQMFQPSAPWWRLFIKLT